MVNLVLDGVERCFDLAPIEVVGLLRHAVEQQLRHAGDLTYM
jgi:hypothetical protein